MTLARLKSVRTEAPSCFRPREFLNNVEGDTDRLWLMTLTAEGGPSFAVFARLGITRTRTNHCFNYLTTN